MDINRLSDFNLSG